MRNGRGRDAPVLAPRAAAITSPDQEWGYDSSFFLWESSPWEVDYLFYLFFFEDGYTWGQEDQWGQGET